MYLRPDEVARELEKAGFTVDVVTQKAYGYRRGDNYVYVNREGAHCADHSSDVERETPFLRGACFRDENQRPLPAVPALFRGQ